MTCLEPLVVSKPAHRLLRARLSSLGFDEAGCAERLRIPSIRTVVPRLFVRRMLGAGDRFPRHPNEPLDVLVALLLFQEPQPLERVLDALGADGLDALVETRLARIEEGQVRANALLFPCRGLLLATDGLDSDSGANPVMPLFPESYDLGAVARREPVERALDLGTGCGIHALLASRHAGEVLGVDVSPRAVAFAVFNASLNGIDNARFFVGSLCDAIRPGLCFGLITANPPYNPEIASPAGADYHSGGESGEELLSRIVPAAQGRLAEGGHCQIITLLIQRRHESLRRRIESWLGPEGRTCDVFISSRRVSYRPRLMLGEGLTPEERALRESWSRQGIVGFSFGLVHLRRTRGGRKVLGLPIGA